MGSDPGDGWPSKYDYYDNPRKERHICTVKIGWKPEGREKFVSWEFEEDNVRESVAELAWILDDPKSFTEECAAPNVTVSDVNAAQDIILHILHTLQFGIPADLEEFHSYVEHINGNSKGDRKKRRFVDEVKDFAIKIRAAPEQRQDELMKKLRSHIRFEELTWVLSKLDPVMVRQDIMSIDPHSVGGRGKKGPVWLAARLIAMANAGDEFDLPRANESDDDYIEYVSTALATARTPGRGKPKSAAKKPKSAAKKP